MVSYKLFFVVPADIRGRTVITPDLTFNVKHDIKSDFNCSICNNGIGISWRQGPKDGMIVLCPTCKSHNQFVRQET